MKKKKKEFDPNSLIAHSDLLQKEQERSEKNRIKNKPIVFVTYVMVFLFLGLFGYLLKFMFMDADSIIANSGNKRQNSFAETICRGDIRSSDGQVLAHTNVNEDGSETRVYPTGDMFCHVVGYNAYGKAGMELSENFNLLRSNVNIFKKVYHEIRDEKNMGDTVVSTLDYNLQKAAYEALGSSQGAVVVLEPDTGKVLVLLSKPGYDPNDIENVWNTVHSDEGSTSTVLLNRATQGLYAPGSTFKVVTSLEFIRENPSADTYMHTCTSEATYNSVTIHCAGKRAHGDVSLADSLAYSCNTSYADIGTQLNLAKFRETADGLLFNNDLPYDGYYTSSKFVLDGNSEGYEVPQTVIGQGKTQITPLHNAMIVSSIANGGVLMKPYLVDRIENVDGAIISKNKSRSYKALMTPSESTKLIELMKGVAGYGTASGAFSGAPYTVAGKTGTAEYDNQGNCNSWFIGMYNPENPEIVISVVVENSGSTGITGVSVARKVFDAYYGSRQ